MLIIRSEKMVSIGMRNARGKVEMHIYSILVSADASREESIWRLRFTRKKDIDMNLR
jgi:hypothetical protein